MAIKDLKNALGKIDDRERKLRDQVKASGGQYGDINRELMSNDIWRNALSGAIVDARKRRKQSTMA
jgi:hypothetical protein